MLASPVRHLRLNSDVAVTFGGQILLYISVYQLMGEPLCNSRPLTQEEEDRTVISTLGEDMSTAGEGRNDDQWDTDT